MVQFIKNRFKGSEMTHKNEETVVDAQMHHLFRCLVAGPSQSGKSTFVRNLLLQQNDTIDICFNYVLIILGTEANKNEILSSLKDELRPGVMEIIELKNLYETTELMKKNFCSEFEYFVKNKANRKKRDVLFLMTSCQSSQNVAFCLIYSASTHLIMILPQSI